MFSGNLPDRIRVHCRNQVRWTRDTPDWLSWDRHRSYCQQPRNRFISNENLRGTVERKPSNSNTTKILQTWSGSPYTFYTSGVYTVWRYGHCLAAEVLAQHGHIRKTSRRSCIDWFLVRNTEFCTSRPNRRHQE